jgi:hypothetical protein
MLEEFSPNLSMYANLYCCGQLCHILYCENDTLAIISLI